MVTGSRVSHRARARGVRLVLTDCDGVLTDAGVYYAESGEELRRFSVRDGMGVARLRAQGIRVGIITGESSPVIASRARKLELDLVYLGIGDKREHFGRILADAGCAAAEVAYIGDDVNDLPLLVHLGSMGLTGAPEDAEPEVKRVVHFECSRRGGQGAFREFSDWILALRREEAVGRLG